MRTQIKLRAADDAKAAEAEKKALIASGLISAEDAAMVEDAAEEVEEEEEELNKTQKKMKGLRSQKKPGSRFGKKG